MPSSTSPNSTQYYSTAPPKTLSKPNNNNQKKKSPSKPINLTPNPNRKPFLSIPSLTSNGLLRKSRAKFPLLVPTTKPLPQPIVSFCMGEKAYLLNQNNSMMCMLSIFRVGFGKSFSVLMDLLLPITSFSQKLTIFQRAQL